MKLHLALALALLCLIDGNVSSAELKVNLSLPDQRKDILMPHWENWKWQEGKTGSRTFGDVTVTFQGASGSTLNSIWFKALLEHGVHMSLTGISVKGPDSDGQIVMMIRGLSPGKHTVATYHNEVRDITPPKYDILVGETVVVRGLVPTKRATSDYEAGCAYFAVNAQAGKDVVVRFRPDTSGTLRTCIINGFEIDTVDPHKKAIKPSPANDDEHVPVEPVLEWTAPKAAQSHQLYFGTNRDAVAQATETAPEFKGDLRQARYPLPRLDPMKTYFWRVDEVHPGEPPVKGEVWRIRPRSLAFPTAEGYGRFARGGRGGRVIEVTNLQDYDSTKGEAVIPGSFRAAIEAEGPRTVVFRVSGLIQLKRPCPIVNPYITIAGQTAPGDGICLANYSVGLLGTHDVIVRFLRVRVGDKCRRAMDGMGMGSSDHSIIDHCSISWSLDEGVSSRGGRNITFQRNIVSEALQHSYHYKAKDRTQFEPHAFAGSISGRIGSFHHNLLAHCTDRNWSLAGGYDQAGRYAGYLDIRNNVVYNWLGRTTDGGVMQCNYVNNYYKPYPRNPFAKWLLKLDPIDPTHGVPKYYMVGNVMEGMDYDEANWKAFHNGAAVEAQVRVNEPLFEPYVKTQSAREAFRDVLANVGATYPRQDVIDRRVIEEVRTGTVHYTGSKGPTFVPPRKNYPGIIDTQDDVKDAVDSPVAPWPLYRTANVPVDSDHDGMPDEWEKMVGLDPNDPSDANADRDGDGYTNLEEYLGYLVGEFPAPARRGK
jgi:hypothetical protein